MLISNIFAIDASNAKDTGFILLGLRLGSSLYVTDKDFMTYEVFTIYMLPWSWKLYSDWIIPTRWNLEGGLIRSKGDNELLITSGPGVAIRNNRWAIWIDGGAGLAFLSSDKIGTRDFGAPIQFTGHAGISYNFGWNLVLG